MVNKIMIELSNPHGSDVTIVDFSDISDSLFLSNPHGSDVTNVGI
ncbi:hypothetical protein SULYE_0737 [Sulfurihydrogenibium yellowstonense SS-5]|uniref:Uncharacterized protein n=1 Tax=Sulfurihydrogenibium yellowstonense SS-5 TaxID=432331 RepID=C4FJJ0_9AQUI|nr:hypothetical protein SULYE_0737 [Sulfurihydrogenibium yellowstonense SS-5]